MGLHKALIVAAVIVVVGITYLVSTRHLSAPQLSPDIFNTPPTGPVTLDPSPPLNSAEALDESLPGDARLSDKERVALIKRAMSKSMAETRDIYAKGFVESGLASPDSERIAQEFIDGVAECIFEAAWKEYEAQGTGLNEFLDGVEIAWSQPIELGLRNVSRIQSRAAPCIATASQRAGVPMPVDYGSAGNDLAERFGAGLEPPPWAGEMEVGIRDHIASYPGLTITGVLATCRNNGCNVMIVGRDIRIFDLEFDRFAEENGFQHAVLGGDGDRRFVWLPR